MKPRSEATIAVIEMPQYTQLKIEDSFGSGMKVDRVLNIPIPFSYGYLKGTSAPDGDHADVFLITDEPLYPGLSVPVKIVGKFVAMDNGVSDDKFLAVIDERKPTLEEILSIEHYLTTYKEGFEVLDYVSGLNLAHELGDAE